MPPAVSDREHPSSAFLVIEVAVTSVGLDRLKASLYAAGTTDHWLVDVGRRAVEVYA